MIPAPHDITVKRGDTFSMFCRARDKVWDVPTSSWVPGPYKDLTGWVGTSHLREDFDSSTIAATATITLGNQGTVPGSFFMTMTAAVTAAITSLGGVYDIQFVTPATEVYTYAGGMWTLSKDVTHV